MAGATETSKTTLPQPKLGGCGGCTYLYNPQDGCYYRQGLGGCTGPCSCSPIICGFGSTLMRLLRPKTVSSAAAFPLACLVAASDEEWLAKALHELVAGKSSPATFWWRVSLGLGALSVVLAIALTIALLYR